MRSIKIVMPVLLAAMCLTLPACVSSTGSPAPGRSVHDIGPASQMRLGRGPWWRYGGYYPRPIPPEPTLPIEPPPRAVPLPLPDPGFGGGDFGGIDGGDFGF